MGFPWDPRDPWEFLPSAHLSTLAPKSMSTSCRPQGQRGVEVKFDFVDDDNFDFFVDFDFDASVHG